MWIYFCVFVGLSRFKNICTVFLSQVLRSTGSRKQSTSWCYISCRVGPTEQLDGLINQLSVRRAEQQCVLTVRFDWCRWWRWCDTGVGHLQVPGRLHTGVFTKHPLSDRDLTGPLVPAAGDRHRVVRTRGSRRGSGPDLIPPEHPSVLKP